jgi:pimeloyl-ACP methyl ester carboxylesterase
MSGSTRPSRTKPIAIAIVLVGILVLAGLVVAYGPWKGTASASPGTGIPPTNYTVVPYSSSVDGFALSFDEWLPFGYSPAQAYPLIVYLHGQQDTSGAWFSGGLASDLVMALGNLSDPTDRATAEALVNATRAQPAILIAVNTRSGSGWYINSPCGGPQEQDVLDAIAFEKERRLVSRVYLMGESMGTEGTLYVASQNPGLFAGIAVIAPVTDLFEDVAYRMTLVNDTQDPWAAISIQAKAHLFCGVLPGTGNASQMSVARMFQNMSPLRFNPEAFAGIPIYMTAGGLDDRAPNNVSIWADWMNANNTVVNATCHYAAELGEPEPPSCATQTLETLHRSDPSAYTFRFIWEQQSTHAISQLDPEDLMGFWFDGLPGGYYLGAASSTVVEPAPGLTY